MNPAIRQRRRVAGLNILADMGTYIIDFSLNRVSVKTIPLIESACPYPALYPDSAKRMDGALFITLHHNPDWPRDIFCHKVHVICANSQSIDLLVEPNRLLANGLFDNLPFIKRKSHRFLCERPHICRGK